MNFISSIEFKYKPQSPTFEYNLDAVYTTLQFTSKSSTDLNTAYTPSSCIFINLDHIQNIYTILGFSSPFPSLSLSSLI